MSAASLSKASEPESVVGRLYERLFADYRIVIADTPPLREACQRLRHQVYCVENPFETASGGVDGIERDAYDDFSAHALLMHRPTGLAAGTVRLVLPGAPLEPPLPMLAVVGPGAIAPEYASRIERCGEISRFAISKQFWHATANAAPCANGAGPARRRARSERDIVTVALVAAFVELAAMHDIESLCALMEPGLLMRARHLGLIFHRLAPPVDFRGLRQPSIIEVPEMLATMRRRRPDVWWIVSRGALCMAAGDVGDA